MSIFGAMFSGVSGLFAQSQKISAISDNISNANTVGYKRTEVPFSTLVTQQASSRAYSAGGVRAAPYMQVDRQGLLQATSSATDLAINGSGFFVVNTAAAGSADNLRGNALFTRAGSFLPDSNGNLRNTAGLYLQGWKLDSGGEFLNGEPARTSFASLETVNVTGLNFTGAPTTEIAFAGNLPADQTGTGSDLTPITTGIEYFDPLGRARTLDMKWTPAETYGQWTLELVDSQSGKFLSAFQVDFHTSGPLSGRPSAIQPIDATTARANAVTETDNGNTYTGDVITIDVTGSTFADGDNVTGTIGGQAFIYPTVAGDAADDSQFATNLAAHLQAAGLTGVTSVAAVGTTITVTGTATSAGAKLIAGGNTEITSGNATVTVDDASGDATDDLVPDVLSYDLDTANLNLQDGDTLSVTVLGNPVSLTVTQAMIDGNTLAAELGTAIDGLALPALAASTAASGVLTITGANDSIPGSGLVENSSLGRITITRAATNFTRFVDADGNSLTPTTAGDPIIAQFTVDLPDGQTQQLNLNLGGIGDAGGMTQFAGDYVPTLIERDGAQFGTLDRVEIDEEGVMTAIFDNGQVRPIYRIPIADFTNPNGLIAVDGNAFQLSAAAGAYYMWDAGIGPAGAVAGSSLENSTVDIAEEFSNMIIAQRAYSSNAKIIQTADEMLQEITNLKR